MTVSLGANGGLKLDDGVPRQDAVPLLPPPRKGYRKGDFVKNIGQPRTVVDFARNTDLGMGALSVGELMIVVRIPAVVVLLAPPPLRKENPKEGFATSIGPPLIEEDFARSNDP